MLEFLGTLVHRISLSFSSYDDVWRAENETIKTNKKNHPHNTELYYVLLATYLCQDCMDAH